MQKQTKPKPLGAPMAKLVLAVSLIVGIGAVIGVMGYAITKPKCEVPKSDGTVGMPMREASKHIPKSCAKNEDCGIDTCQQGRDKCVEIRYVCEMEKCVFPNKTTEFSYPPYKCWEGKCKTEEVIADETADWKTYRNEEYGFELKYPPDWNVEDLSRSLSYTTILINPPVITTRKPIYDAIVVNIDTTNKINTTEEYLDKNILIDPNAEPQEFKKFIELFPDYKIVKVDNIDSVQYKSEVTAIATSTQKITNTVLPTNKGVIEVITDEDYKDIYNQILSTFKFTEK